MRANPGISAHKPSNDLEIIMAFLRKIQRVNPYSAPEPSFTTDTRARHCAGSKTFKRTHCASKFSGQGRSTHAPWVTHER
jgi:hypothetical protein